MPTYCYTAPESPKIFDREFPAGKAPDKIFVEENGYSLQAFRDRQAEVAGMHLSVRGSENPTQQRRRQNPWPMEPCVASGVHPSQAQELRDHLTSRGCPTEVSRDGEPIYTSAAHRKRALKCRGMYDRNSYN